jgi:RNA polymerase sigma-70 factor (ECF subfamily)
MQQQALIPHLFRTEYRKIVAVLCNLFGIDHIETAEDIVSDTFLTAAELWGRNGLPENPTAWLYTVAKNRTKDYLKRNNLFTQKIVGAIQQSSPSFEEIDIDLSTKNIDDSQLSMMFAVCHPCISTESQIGLSLNLLCGFGVEEIADAFLTNKETIYKRLKRAKEKLKAENVKIEQPSLSEINERLATVLTTLYLLFNEGYYSTSQNTSLRKDLCIEAMRLNFLLIDNPTTNQPTVNALFSLMSFHASRFDARTNQAGDIVLYEDQDTNLWNQQLITQGEYYLNRASKGNHVSKYHLEAAIAYWHTQKQDAHSKWENILQLYNRLLQIEYSPIAALNRTYALAKANSIEEAIIEAEKLNLTSSHLYHSLLANLYSQHNKLKALYHYTIALGLAKSVADKAVIERNIAKLDADS